MADLRVFISSTCYDLAVLREQLRAFLHSLGHQPVMSEYSDVLFDPATHTHASCVKEVTSCDYAILIIGGRYGGKAVPEAISQINLDALKDESLSQWCLDNHDSLSITNLEVLAAIGETIPLITFVDTRVWHDHHVYESNKKSPHCSSIVFPSIEKQETAPYIFEFINFLRHRGQNNSIHPFSRFEDVTDALKRQWSSFFQRLLSDRRSQVRSEAIAERLQDQFASLQAAVLSSIQQPDLRNIARKVVQFQRLIGFISGITQDPLQAVRTPRPFSDLLMDAGVSEIYVVRRQSMTTARYTRMSVLFKFLNGNIKEFSGSAQRFYEDIAEQWAPFTAHDLGTREAVVEAWLEARTGEMLRPMRNDYFEILTKREGFEYYVIWSSSNPRVFDFSMDTISKLDALENSDD